LIRNKNKNETLLVNVSNSTVKNIFENGMIPKVIKKNGPPQCGIYTLTLAIVGRSRGDVSSHQDIFQTFGFPESLQYIRETKQQLSKRLNGHRSDANCKPDLPLSRHLRSKGHHDYLGKLKVTIRNKNKNETLLDNVSNSTVKNIFENGMIPKLIKKNGPPQCGIYTLGQLNKLYVLIRLEETILS
jgi:hypothetical protein